MTDSVWKRLSDKRTAFREDRRAFDAALQPAFDGYLASALAALGQIGKGDWQRVLDVHRAVFDDHYPLAPPIASGSSEWPRVRQVIERNALDLLGREVCLSRASRKAAGAVLCSGESTR